MSAGHLVGINSAIYSRTGGSQGIGFAIPVSIARQVMEQIIKSGSVTRGWVGIEVQDITPELAESFNLKNVDGAQSRACWKAVRPRRRHPSGRYFAGGQRQQGVQLCLLLNLIAALKPGDVARLTVARRQQSLDLKIQVGGAPYSARWSRRWTQTEPKRFGRVCASGSSTTIPPLDRIRIYLLLFMPPALRQHADAVTKVVDQLIAPERPQPQQAAAGSTAGWRMLCCAQTLT